MYMWMYIPLMTKRYSLAEARKNLPSILDDAEAGTVVEITRRGKPVALVIGPAEFQQLRGRKPTFAQAYANYLKKLGREPVGVEPGYFDALRPKETGRKVKL
jgi:prevent-host-death family protein